MRQSARLRQPRRLAARARPAFLFELLVPPTPEQIEAAGGDEQRWDSEERPKLMDAAIGELQDAGVEPDIWKIEGIDRREDCETISATTRRDGRDGVACVVLGRGADDAAVDHWLRMGSGVPGYIGFAIGRSIWWDPLKGFVDGNLGREEAAKQIAANYRRFIDVYNGEGGVAMAVIKTIDLVGCLVGVVAGRGPSGAGRGREDDPRHRVDGHPRHDARSWTTA